MANAKTKRRSPSPRSSSPGTARGTLKRATASRPIARPRKQKPTAPASRKLSSRQQVAAIAVSAVVVTAATVVAGQVRTGFDSTWALLWARNLLHANAASIPTGAFTVTPHPGAIALGVLASVGGFGHAAMTTWALLLEIAALAMFAGVVRLGVVCGSYPAGWIAAIAIALQPGVRDSVGRGTTDIVCAAACVWALALVTRHPKLAIGLATLAALYRPEAWLLLPIFTGVRWRDISRSTRITTLVCGTAIPVIWLLMGAVFFNDPLAALHITVTNGQGVAANGGMTGLIHAFFDLPGWFGPIALIGFVVAAVGARRQPQLLLTTAASAALLAGLILEVADGAAFTARYLIATVALMLPLALAAIFTRSRTLRWPFATWRFVTWRLAAIVICVTLTSVATYSTRHTRLGSNDRFATQGRAVTALFTVLKPSATANCHGVTIPQTALTPAIALAFPNSTHIQITSNRFNGNINQPTQPCLLVVHNPNAVNAAGWGPIGIGEIANGYLPNARLIAGNNEWALYEH